MSATQRHLAQVTRFAGERIVVTCEHASNAVPGALGKQALGVGGSVLRSHVAWDPGAREIASILAHRLGAAQFMGRQTRLVVDLNRSRGSKGLIPRESFGVKIPGNARLSRKEREARIEKYWQPYRDTVEAAVKRAIERGGECLHLSVHSFVPTLDGEVRTAEVGLLYDPKRAKERKFAERVRDYLEQAIVGTRMNYPYKGTADGFTTHLRRELPKSRYVGIELELNQTILETNRQRWRIGTVLADAVASAIEL